jgi:hypothetical protein
MNEYLRVGVKDAFDLHVHSAPCLFPRIADDIEMATEAKRLGMSAIALKSPFESSVGRAYHTSKQVGFPVYGGLILNQWTGGINPSAVFKTLKLGGRLIWMPTFDAAYHAKVYGGTGKYQQRSMRVDSLAKLGISITKDGELIEEAKMVVELVKEHDAILGTGHVSGEEIRALVEYGVKIGGAKIVITHPEWPAPGVDIGFLQEMVKMGAMAELCASSIGPLTYFLPPTKAKEWIEALGPEHIILSSDCGVAFYPMPMEYLRVFAACLFESGVSEGDLRRMMVENQKKLLGIAE